MTAIIGHLFEDGVFVSADTRRISEIDTNRYKKNVTEKFEKIIARKIHKLTDTIAIAVAGTASDTGPVQEIQWNVNNRMKKEQIETIIIQTFAKYQINGSFNEILLFGIDEGKSFLVHIDLTLKVKNLETGTFIGIADEEYNQVADDMELKAQSTFDEVLYLDIWAQFCFNKIIKETLPSLAKEEEDKGEKKIILSSVDYPIDMVIIRKEDQTFTFKGVNTIVDSTNNIELFKDGIEISELPDDSFATHI
ncbi:Ntn hydrolase family protein [Bacillus cihuensis]|uniref:hypothetical protein n=1 Tax=Bacillus cihuensis TaxID=1208599 RepID=UPI000424D51F|nr:hypothetical protein [Bacillus cihuensis]